MALPRPDDLLAVAHVIKPHGVHGEMSAVVLAPEVLDIAELMMRRLYARQGTGEVREVQCLGIRPHQDRLLVVLDGIETMDAADAMRGVDLCLPREELPELPEGWYWESDLQACRVNDRTLGDIGAVQGLKVGGAQPQLELKRPDGSVALIPWVKAFIIQVDLKAHLIQTDLPGDFPGITSSATSL